MREVFIVAISAIPVGEYVWSLKHGANCRGDRAWKVLETDPQISVCLGCGLTIMHISGVFYVIREVKPRGIA